MIWITNVRTTIPSRTNEPMRVHKTNTLTVGARTTHRVRSTYLWLSFIVAFFLPSRHVAAQQLPSVEGRYFPLNQMTPPGTAAQWATNLGRATPEYFQPVKISLPTEGEITFYEGASHRAMDLPAPAQASLVVGRMYRLRIRSMPEYPGVEFYPSIELIDRLHPPAGKADQFPVEFEFTEEELEWAASERLVTKVVYLEQPNRIPVPILESKQRITTVEPSTNAIAEADRLGRPIAIVRLGGRTPDPIHPEPAFFGPGGPIRVTQKAEQTTSQNRSTMPAREISLKAGKVGIVNLGQGSPRPIAQR